MGIYAQKKYYAKLTFFIQSSLLASFAKRSSGLGRGYWSMSKAWLMVDFVFTTNSQGSVLLRDWNDICAIFVMPVDSNRCSSFSMAGLMANDTARGLKNFGRASGRIYNLAWIGCTVPGSALKTSLCLFNKRWNGTVSLAGLTVLMLYLSRWSYCNQFVPNGDRSYPATTTSARCLYCCLYLTCTESSPNTAIGSPV